MPKDRDMRPSEFGGKPGRAQLAEDGHTITASEEMAAMYATDSTDANAEADAHTLNDAL